MRRIIPVLILLLTTASAQAFQHAELDNYWEELSTTVQEGDFEGYSDLYHEDAILVSGMQGNSYKISVALAGWKQGFEDTKAGKMQATVEFRFSERLVGEGTAFEVGIFKYISKQEGQDPQVFLAHFEGLLIEKDGKWLMMMENQKSVATEEEWNALGK
jgi:ketosteroid isomerase-like protein